MAVLDTTAFANALKILYPRGLEELMYPSCPLLEWLPKSYDFEGSSKQIRPLIGPIRGSTDFATALAGKSTPTIKDFTVTRVKDYVIGSIDNEALMASRSQKGAQRQAVQTSIDAAMYTMGRSAAHQLWGNGGGALGQISTGSSVGTATITLEDTRDIVNFEVGMVLQAGSTDGTSGSARTGTVSITGVNRNSGTLTASGNWSAGIPAVATSDYLFRQGDFGNVLTGVLGWVPTSDPSATLFFGVDRTADITRLSGIRITGTASIEETVFDAQAEAAINGARVDTLWMNSKRYAELCKSLQGKAWYPQNAMGSGDAKVGTRGFVFPGERGDVVVKPDPNCPYAYGLMTRKASWELACLGKCPHFSQEDGLKFSRESSADAIEFRLKVYWQLLCKRPVDNVLITWA